MIFIIYLIGSGQLQRISSFTCHMLSPLVLQPGSWCTCVTRVSRVSAGQSREIQQSDKEQDKVCSSWQQRFTQENLEGSRRPCQNWSESQSLQVMLGCQTCSTVMCCNGAVTHQINWLGTDAWVLPLASLYLFILNYQVTNSQLLPNYQISSAVSRFPPISIILPALGQF